MTIRQGLWACVRIAPLSFALGMLAACGGGGGSGGSSSSTGTGGGDSGVSMALSTNTIAQAATTDESAPIATLQASANGITAGQEIYLAASYSKNGIASVSAATGASPITVSIQFQSPATLGAGVYHDSLQLSACYDQACTQEVTNSPQTVSVTYTVTQPAPQVSGVSPTGAAAGGPGFTLEVDGSEFLSQSVVQWNGSP